MPKNWFPLESNPYVMGNYIQSLGVDMTLLKFHDVLSTEEWALEMIPKPVLGVLMLFPIKPSTEAHREEERNFIRDHGQNVSRNVWFTKQTVGNACGTVGLIHCIANAKDQIVIDPNSFFGKFLVATSDMTPEERASFLEEDNEIDVTHSAAALEGQSCVVEDVDTHFVCFTHVDGCLYELDGRKEFPINHGPSSKETLLADACKAITKFMERDPGEMRFTIIALGPNDEV